MSDFFLEDPWVAAHARASDAQLAQQMAALRRQFSRDQAANVADLAGQYPTLDREVIFGAGVMGLQSGSPEMQEIALRSTQIDADVDSENWFERTASWFDGNIWDPFLGVIRGTLRTGFTVWDTMWEEGLSRPFKTVLATLGMSDQHSFMSPIDAWHQAGTSYGMRALGEIVKGNWDGINLGSGFLPRSTLAEETGDYERLIRQGVQPEIARAQVQAQLGEPITQQARASQHQLTMAGQGISPGRFAANIAHYVSGGTLMEPGSTAYNLVSGALDAAVMMGTMRVGRIPNKVPAVFGQRAPKPLRYVPGPRAAGGHPAAMVPFGGMEIPVIGGRTVPILGDPAATMLKHVGMVRRAARTFDSVADDALMAALRAEGYNAFDAGLVRAIRRTVNAPKTEEWLVHPVTRRLIDLLDTKITPKEMAQVVDFFTARNKMLPARFFRELSDARVNSIESSADVMRRWINSGHLRTAPTVVGSVSPLRGRMSRSLGGRPTLQGRYPELARRLGADLDWTPELEEITRELGYLGGYRTRMRASLDSYGWGRMFRDMPGKNIDIEDMDAGFYDLNDWMISAGFSHRRRSEFLYKWSQLDPKADIGKAQTYKVATEAFDALSKDLIREGVPSPVAKWLVTTFRESTETRAYWVDTAGRHRHHPSARTRLLDGGKRGQVTPSPMGEAETIQRMIPLPDAREMRKALSSWRRWLYYGVDPATGQKMSRVDPDSPLYKLWLRSAKKGEMQALELNDSIIQRFLDGYTQRFWKPMTLLRIAWPVRVIGEEQLRMGAAGYTSMFTHPIQWITYCMDDVDANRFTKALDWLGIRPRGKLLTEVDFGDLDPQMIPNFVAGAMHGDDAAAGARRLQRLGYEIDPANPDHVERVQAIRDLGLGAEDLEVALSREWHAAQTRGGGNMWGHYDNPVAAEVWADIPIDSPLRGKAYSGELIQLHHMTLARRIAQHGPEQTKAWLRSADGRRFADEWANTLHDPAAAARVRDIRTVDYLVDSNYARILEKTGGPDARAVLTIDGRAVDGDVLTRAQIRVLEDPREYHRVGYRVTGTPDETALHFIATGEWPGLGQIGAHMRAAQMTAWQTDLMKNYRHIQPSIVKGPMDGSAKRVTDNAYDRVVNWAMNQLMSRPTNALSRSPVFRQDLWKFFDQSIPYASPEVQAKMLQAAHNAGLKPQQIRSLERRIAAARATPGYGVLDDASRARADRIVEASALPDEELVRRVVTSRLMDDLDAANPADVGEWWEKRVMSLGLDDLDDADLAMYVLWQRHADEWGRINGAKMVELDEHAARALGIDMSPTAVRNRQVLTDFTSGTSVGDLATQYGVTPSTVRRWVKQAQAEPHTRIQRAAALHAEGKTWAQVASDLGVSQSTARRWAAQAQRSGTILDTSLDSFWDMWGSQRAQTLLGSHFDHYTDLVGGQRRAMSAHGFDDVVDPTTGAMLRDGWDEWEMLAKAHALETVKNLLYDTTRRHQVMDIARNVFPFGEAWVEVLSTWGRLMVQNPQILRRGQQIIESAREGDPFNTGRGFFFTDPTTGEEMFNYPGAGMLFNAASKQPSGAGATAAAGAGVGGTLGAAGGPLGAMIGAGAGGLVGAALPGAGLMPTELPFAGALGQPSEGTTAAAEGAGALGMRMQGSLTGLNLMAGSYIPGFGPVVQVLASHLFGDNPMFDAVRDLVTPFGDQRISEVGDIADLTMPRWATRLFTAIGVRSPETERVFGNTVIDVYKTLVLTEGEPKTQEESNRMLERAKGMARKLTMYRAFAYMFSPTPPQIQFEVADRDGTLWLFQTLATEYATILHEECHGDDVEAFDKFWRRYGLDPTLFATAKSVQIAPRSVTESGDRWARGNKDLFQKAPATAYYSHPDDPVDESFDYRAYVRQLQDDARQGLSPEQWVMRRNDTLGRLVYEKARREVDEALVGGSTQKKTIVLRMVRQWLTARYPGYKVPIPGTPQTYSADQKIREFREQWFGQKPEAYWPDGSIRWVGERTGGDPRLYNSETGRGLWLWLQAVDAMTEKAVGQGLTAGGLWSAQSAWPLREALRMYAARLMRRYDDFQYVYRLVLEQQYPDSDFQMSGLRSATGGA